VVTNDSIASAETAATIAQTAIHGRAFARIRKPVGIIDGSITTCSPQHSLYGGGCVPPHRLHPLSLCMPHLLPES